MAKAAAATKPKGPIQSLRGKRGTAPQGLAAIRTDEIRPNPHQPRRSFQRDELEGLAESIRQNGILQPLTVRAIRKPPGGYELIAGERRLRAARMAGLSTVPCLVIESTDEASAVMALVENLQRQDLNFFEEAEAIARLMERYGVSQERMAKSLGKAPSTLSNKLRILKLPIELRELIRASDLTERHARALLRLENPGQQKEILQAIIAKELNVSDTDKLIDALLRNKTKPVPPSKSTIRLVRDVRLFVNTIHHAIDTMKRAGIPAESSKHETAEYIEYTVRIPKQDACAAKQQAG
ncbi:MAG: ParB/RepB/Spo0J family partition protein [Oscillospiraceae bacterium]|nr:ParB/RepB/Spo0J family partition protein [Oscillospiraceae bacterium]